MITHKDDVYRFHVTDIETKGRMRSFEIYAVFEDEAAMRVAVHIQDVVECYELFKFHHQECVRIYTTLS